MVKAVIAPGVAIAYTEALEDVPVNVLADTFERAEKMYGFIPTVPEIRNLAGWGLEQRAKIEVDRAWQWIADYLEEYGPEGAAKKYHKYSAEERAACKMCGGIGMVVDRNKIPQRAERCDCQEIERIEAPKIPARIEYALRQLATKTVDALIAIQECDAKYQPKMRQQFNEAFERSEIALRDSQYAIQFKRSSAETEVPAQVSQSEM